MKGPIQKAWSGGEGWGMGILPHCEGGQAPPQKKEFLTWNGVLVNPERYFFCPCTGWKNAVFLAWSSYMVYVEDEQSIAITASLGSALYWCLKFWNMTKSREQFALAFPPQQILGTHPPFPGDLLPCSKCSYFVTYAVQHGKQYHWTAGKKTDLSSEYNSEKKRVKLKWENG